MEVLDAEKERRLKIVARNMKVDAVTVEVTRAFDAAGIRSILLKGPTIARWLYDHPWERPYWDTDLLVAPWDIDKAEEILTDLGFHHDPLDDIPGDKPWHAHAWERGDEIVDLHRTLVGIRVNPEDAWRVLSGVLSQIRLSDFSLPCLSLPARGLHLCLHAAQDGTQLVKAQQDLALALKTVNSEIWTEALVLSRELGAEPAIAAGLELADPHAAVRLGAAKNSTVEAQLRSGDAPPESIGLWWLLQLPETSEKLKLAARKLFPSAAFMRSWTPLARKGHLGLMLSYPYRVASLAKRFPRALIHLLGAYRAGRSKH